MSGFTPKLLLLAAVATAGCATESDFHVDNRKAYYSGNTELAIAKIDQAIKEYPEESDFLKLDRAMVMLSDGHPKEAELLLKEVRDRWDEEDTVQERSLGQNQFARISQNGGDDKGYEKVMIRLMLSLCNLMADGVDTEKYAQEANRLQNKIVSQMIADTNQKKFDKQHFSTIPLAEYISGVLQEVSLARYEEAAESYQKIAWIVPEGKTNVYLQDFERVKARQHCKEENGVVYVIVMIGRGCRRIESPEKVNPQDLKMANQILSDARGNQVIVEPESIKTRKFERAKNEFGLSCAVRVDGEVVGYSQLVTSNEELCIAQVFATEPRRVAESLVRHKLRMGYFSEICSATDDTRRLLISKSAKYIKIDKADLERVEVGSWDFLPSEFHTFRIELPAGDHQIILSNNGGMSFGGYCPEYSNWGRRENETVPVKIRVEKGKNTYVLANNVGDRFVGKMSTNRPAD